MIQLLEINHKGKTYWWFQELGAFGQAKEEWLFTNKEFKLAEKRSKAFSRTVPMKDYNYIR